MSIKRHVFSQVTVEFISTNTILSVYDLPLRLSIKSKVHANKTETMKYFSSAFTPKLPKKPKPRKENSVM